MEPHFFQLLDRIRFQAAMSALAREGKNLALISQIQALSEHYKEAFYAGCEEQLDQVAKIVGNTDAPTFENTIVEMEKSGGILTRMLMVFYNKSSSDTSDSLDAIEAEIAPKLAAHTDAIKLNPALWSRIKTIYQNKSSLNEEDAWLTEKYYKDFLHAGADLSQSARARVMEINEELSALETKFSQDLLADTNDLAIFVDTVSDLDGLSDGEIAAAKAAAQSRGKDDKWMVAMVNFTGNPVLSSLKNRKLREKIMKASLVKANQDNEKDTKPTLIKMVTLRAERSKLFGFKNHAEYVISAQTAGNATNVHAMMRQVAAPAVRNARAEGADIQRMRQLIDALVA